jgi:hypothetical protein
VHAKRWSANGDTESAPSFHCLIHLPGSEANPVRLYNREYRRLLEGDFADAALSHIKEQIRNKDPFFLTVGWTRPNFPNEAASARRKIIMRDNSRR